MSLLFWVLLAIGLAVIEIVSVTFFPIFFTVSAIVAAGLQVAGLGPGWQWAAFGLGGLLLSLVLRPIAKRQLAEGPTLKSSIEELSGRTAVVITAIEGRGGVGTVSVDGQTWTARADDDAASAIAVGADVEILKVRGATLVVAPNRAGVR